MFLSQQEHPNQNPHPWLPPTPSSSDEGILPPKSPKRPHWHVAIGGGENSFLAPCGNMQSPGVWGTLNVPILLCNPSEKVPDVCLSTSRYIGFIVTRSNGFQWNFWIRYFSIGLLSGTTESEWDFHYHLPSGFHHNHLLLRQSGFLSLQKQENDSLV